MTLLPVTSRTLIRTAAGRVLPLVKRPYTTPPKKHKNEEVHNYNTPEFYWEGYEDREDDEHNYPRVTAQGLAKRRKPPAGVKMLVRDFIQNSLYNPHYGYFSKRAIIFSTKDPFNFNCLPENAAFQSEVARVYQQYEQGDPDDPRNKGPGRQIWHTPTELFKVFTIFYKLIMFPNISFASRTTVKQSRSALYQSICSNTSRMRILSSMR